MKKQITDRLLKDSALYPMGRKLEVIQPHFVRLSVRVWLEKDNLENAYDLQVKAKEMIENFIDPLQGGQGLQGWEIGEFPRSSQIIAYLRTGISGCNISKILMTAEIDGKEVPNNILCCSGSDISNAIGGKSGTNAMKAFDEFKKQITLSDVIVSCTFDSCGKKIAEAIQDYILIGTENFEHLASKAYSWCKGV
jgi:hypothetical protein